MPRGAACGPPLERAMHTFNAKCAHDTLHVTETERKRGGGERKREKRRKTERERNKTHRVTVSLC